MHICSVITSYTNVYKNIQHNFRDKMNSLLPYYFRGEKKCELRNKRRMYKLYLLWISKNDPQMQRITIMAFVH